MKDKGLSLDEAEGGMEAEVVGRSRQVREGEPRLWEHEK